MLLCIKTWLKSSCHRIILSGAMTQSGDFRSVDLGLLPIKGTSQPISNRGHSLSGLPRAATDGRLPQSQAKGVARGCRFQAVARCTEARRVRPSLLVQGLRTAVLTCPESPDQSCRLIRATTMRQSGRRLWGIRRGFYSRRLTSMWT